MKFLTLICTLLFLSLNSFAFDNLSLSPELQEKNKAAINAMSDALSLAESEQTNTNVKIKVDATFKLINPEKAAQIINESFELPGHKEMVQFIKNVNGEFNAASLVLPESMLDIKGPIYSIEGGCRCVCNGCN